MKLIEADKVEQAIKDYWKAQVDKALTLTDGNEKRINIYLEHNHDLLKAIDELPSVQPDTTTHDSIPAETGENDGDRTSGDCISRTQAIDALCKSECGWNNAECRHKDDTDFCVTCDNVKIIKSLPSAQPERKTGHWIAITSWNNTYKCSVCGRLLVNITDGKNKVAKNYPYCHCGADMRGDKHEDD